MFSKLSFSLSIIALFFCGCSTINGAKALEFFSYLDNYGHWKTHNRTDFEGRILSGKVACIEAEMLTFDKQSNDMKASGSVKKCWDDFGILIEYLSKDTSGNSVIHQKSETENGYLLSRVVDIHYPKQSKRHPRHFDIQMTESDNGSIKTRTYTETSDSGKVFTIQFQTEDNKKIQSAQIDYPYSHKLDFSYNEKGDLVRVIDKDWGKSYRIDFISNPNENAEKAEIVYQGKTYSYALKKMNSRKQPIEEMYSDEFLKEQIHRKYTYTQDGRTETIWENGVSRNIIYEDGKFVREEYYDYGNTLRAVVDIETDSYGNVKQSSYYSVKSGKPNEKPQKQFKYTIQYR